MRKNTRYTADAEVYVSPFPERRMLLKDISLNGCCIHADDFVEILPNTLFMIGVVPKDSVDVENFALSVKARWFRSRKDLFESGVEILAPEESLSLGRYIKFLVQKET